MKRLSMMLLLLVAGFAGACAPAYVASPGYSYGGRSVRDWHRPRSAVVVVTPPPPPPRVVVYRPGWRAGWR